MGKSNIQNNVIKALSKRNERLKEVKNLWYLTTTFKYFNWMLIEARDRN